MRPDLDAALVRDFPNLYRDRHGDTRETRMCDGFSCGDGWEPLIRRMSERIEPFCVNTNLHCAQVKEKFGALRVYLEGTGLIPDEVEAAVDAAALESQRTCEECCAPGIPRGVVWILTLCADCAALAESRENT
jgi:hypothetical protein